MNVEVEYDFYDEHQAETHRRIQNALAEAASDTARDAAVIAPKLTGNLARNNKDQKVTDNHYIAYNDTEYGPYVEYGTRNMAAQPFMRPAYEKNRQPVIEALGQVLNH